MKAERFHPALEILEGRIAPATLALSGTLLGYTATAGVTNVLTISLAAGIYTFADTGETITLNQAAIDAGFSGSGTNIVTGPASALADIRVDLDNGNDTLNLNGLADGFSLLDGVGSDTVNVNTGATATGDSVRLVAETVNITSLNGATTITIDADTVAVNGDVTLTGALSISPLTAGRPINLGTETAGSLSLTATELGRFSGATKMTIGASNAGAITLSAALSLANAPILSLRTDADISTSGAGAITVAALSIDADATVTLNGPNDVDTLAAIVNDVGADLSFTDADGFQVAAVDGITGLTTSTDTDSFISLTGGASVTQASGSAITGSGLALLGAGGFQLTQQINDIATLAANTQSLVFFTDATGLDVGSVAGVNGVTTNGTLILNARGGDLRVLDANGTAAADIVVGSNSLILTAGAVGSDFAIILNTNAGISGTTNQTNFSADRMVFGASINLGSQNLVLSPFVAGTPVDLGGADAPGVLGLSDADLDRITTTGTVFISAGSSAVTVSGAVTPANFSNLDISPGTMDGPGSIAIESLTITIRDDIALDGANDVDFLLLRPGSPVNTTVSFNDPDGFVLGPPASGLEVSVPDFTVATLTAGGTGVTMNANTNLRLNVSSAGAGSGHDQIGVIGSVTLTGATLTIEPGATPPTQGTAFVLIDNDGSDAVTGTFAGLPEGSVITVGNVTGSLSYLGGDGNDVVFTTFAGLDVTLKNGGKIATFRDVDGDLVTVKTTKGAFDGSEFFGLADGIAGGGQLRSLTLDSDFTGANITITAKRTAEGGNGFVNLGSLDATGVDLGAVKIAGDLGRIAAGTPGGSAKVPALKSLTVHSFGLLGTSTQPSGSASRTSDIEGGVPKFAVLGDVRNAQISLRGDDGRLGALAIGGSMVGDGEFPARFSTTAGIGSVKIGGDIRHSSSVANTLSSGISTNGAIGSINVAGSIIGSAQTNVLIEAVGQTIAPTKGVDTALKSLTVGGSVERLTVLAVGSGGGKNADASIGGISVGGDWIASSAVVGTAVGADNVFGTADDVKVTATRDNPNIFSTIGSFTVKGQAFGTATDTADMFGVVAERIGKAKVGGRTFAFTTGATPEAFFAAPTLDGEGAENPAFDFTIREIGSTTPTPAFGGPDLQISADGRAATFIDVDGDIVTVKRTLGSFVPGDFSITTAATGGGLLGDLTFSAAPGNLSITAVPGPDGGNGRVNIGAILAPNLDLGKVVVAGELTELLAGNVDPAQPGVKSLAVHSIGDLAQGFGTGGNISFDGAGPKITVLTNVRTSDIRNNGVVGTIVIGGFVADGARIEIGTLGSVKIGGSVFGGAEINASFSIDSITIGGDLVGSGPGNTQISALGAQGGATKAPDIAIRSLTIKGSVENTQIEAGLFFSADSSIGAVSVGRAWLGSNLIAGSGKGADGFFGTADDTKNGAGRDQDGFFSTIASVLIKGQAIGSATAGDSFGIVAEVIGKAQIGAVKYKFDKGERDAADAFALAPTGPGSTGLSSDFFLREIVV